MASTPGPGHVCLILCLHWPLPLHQFCVLLARPAPLFPIGPLNIPALPLLRPIMPLIPVDINCHKKPGSYRFPFLVISEATPSFSPHLYLFFIAFTLCFIYTYSLVYLEACKLVYFITVESPEGRMVLGTL